MKLGKRKMVTIFAQETGLPKEHIRIYGKYECFVNKERLQLGAHTLVSYGGTVTILEPVYGSFISIKCQLSDMLCGIKDEDMVFTVGQIKRIFALARN